MRGRNREHVSDSGAIHVACASSVTEDTAQESYARLLSPDEICFQMATAEKLRNELKGYGIEPENIRIFGDEPGPELQDYLALNELRLKNETAPDGVAEFQGRPILYFIDEQRLTNAATPRRGQLFPSDDDESDDLPTIFRQIACRGERVYLARVELGRLRIAPVSSNDITPQWKEYTSGSFEGKCLFSRLAFGMTDNDDFSPGDRVFQRLFELLKHAANRIARNESLRPDALSLVGRALFLRFLCDRGVLDDYSVEKVAAKASSWNACFANAENAAATCKWLDQTFNGDFLPLGDNGSESFFRRIGSDSNGEVFRHLTAVIHGHEPKGEAYQLLLEWDWSKFDFAHVPVGLLSQVYEAFSWEWTPVDAKKKSQHYTPRNIGVTLIDEVFDGLPNITSCRVLDPASGAGVFLVLAFRRLYRELWKSTGIRPGTADIRRILERQLVGLDISESALKLAALSLYLTAIELDPEPTPPHKLRFKNLRGSVLHNVREKGLQEDDSCLGSISPHLKAKFDNQFDVVVSNPPWTSLDEDIGEQLGKAYVDIVSDLDEFGEFAHSLPDNNPDLPFLMKAAQWCKRGGRIAMALHARILLKTELTPTAARQALFKLLQIDGIINGTNLADTLVWPQMNQPWILLFATNQRPSAAHATHFVTLPLDTSLNDTGVFRIDSNSARSIPNSIAVERFGLWKALSVGSTLDLDIVSKMKSATATTLKQYWKEAVGKGRSGKGYQLAEEQKKLTPCPFLVGLPNLNSTDLFDFVVEPSMLGKFKKSRIWRPRRTTIYDPPLVLIKESPGEDRKNGRALLAWERIAYNESFNGYSAAGRADGPDLVRYLHLFAHSTIWEYVLLLTSPSFGAERRRAHKADLDECPFIPFELLTADNRKDLIRLSRAVASGRAIPWNDIDAFFASLYGLRDTDLQVIRDTLAIAMPYDTARKRACASPKADDKASFISSLRTSLSPIVSASNSKLLVERWRTPTRKVHPAFDLVMLATDSKSISIFQTDVDGYLEKVLSLANETGATQIIISPRKGMGLVVGIYNQYRYWTRSRARLLAGDIVRLHLDSITG